MNRKTVQSIAASIAIMTALLSAACGNGATTGDANPDTAPALAGETAAASQVASGSASTPAPTPSPSPAPTVLPEQTGPLYRMNKVYRILPIDETKTPDKMVLLTFDDGPKDEEALTSLLDTLDAHHAKAIFFVNGYRVKQHPELLKLIYDRGQTIGNHSWDHIDLKKEERETVEKQIGDVQRDVEAITGQVPHFFRPPYGSGGDTVKEAALKEGLLFMTWSNGSLDWEQKAPGDPDKVIANVMEQLHPGANILMHELKWTAKALDGLLSKLEKEGYGFIDPASIETPAH
ncbi:polysaccharide deacetylase family protein [Paenibacillus sp. NPDC058071]|uniref:polysaccharide deacetylase family protein n=1 Tax=Paenibacillus sp. NPDC058071 TaxID=3346326 RepID=UPI0036DB6F80